MSKTVNLYEAKTRLSQLVEEASAGEEIIIAKSGKPKARLVPLPAATHARKPGGWEGMVKISEDFDEEMPDDVLSGWYANEDDASS